MGIIPGPKNQLHMYMLNHNQAECKKDECSKSRKKYWPKIIKTESNVRPTIKISNDTKADFKQKILQITVKIKMAQFHGKPNQKQRIVQL